MAEISDFEKHLTAISGQADHPKNLYSLNNHLQIGILGHTNAGKSSLFNLLSPLKKSRVSKDLYTTTNRFLTTFPFNDDNMHSLVEILHPSQVVESPMTLMDTPGITVRMSIIS
jgi:predicted GTPase